MKSPYRRPHAPLAIRIAACGMCTLLALTNVQVRLFAEQRDGASYGHSMPEKPPDVRGLRFVTPTHGHTEINRDVNVALEVGTHEDLRYTAQASAAGAERAGQAQDQAAAAAKKNRQLPWLTIVSPNQGDSLEGPTVDLTLNISTRARERTLQVTLNGKSITDEFRPAGPCQSLSCTVVARVRRSDGLRRGTNRLQARIDGPRGRHDVEKVIFHWQRDVAEPEPEPPFQLTSSIGFTTVAPGGQSSSQPWIQLYSNALAGGTVGYPKASETTCSTLYQVIVLDRATLAELSY